MRRNPIRRSQLIAPFGVGSMIVVQGGVGLLTAGLDHWYEREVGKGDVDVQEYCVHEWRLAKLLGVDHFRLPPDYRDPWHFDPNAPNTGLTVPFHRFPKWHFCPRCGLLDERPLSERSRPKCPECNTAMFQLPFVAICEAGHLQDFPWREWVHHQAAPDCDGLLRLKSTGSASLAGQRVTCEKCRKSRSLSGITSADPDGTTFLSKTLAEDGKEFLCPGHLTWLGPDVTEECTAHLRGSLRNAANVYFAQVRSSIYIPPGAEFVPDELVTVLSKSPFSTLMTLTIGALADTVDRDRAIEIAVDGILRQRRFSPVFSRFRRDQMLQAARVVFGTPKPNGVVEQEPTTLEEFRYKEFEVLREEMETGDLRIRKVNLVDYDHDIAQYFSRIMLLPRLRETRALIGFTRVFAANQRSLTELKAMLRRKQNEDDNWLPAYEVYGEGIFLEFDEQRLKQWETTPEIIDRIGNLNRRYRVVLENRHLLMEEVTPRFVLIHTFAHILMNRLTFECGYSSAALRERLYVSSCKEDPMGGLLIYTAAGDADGTMGGLVRMGKHGYIERAIRSALQDATWCSADPVCYEIGGSGGQGPDSCNLAACHNCALVPETACEHFNRFLDRATVVGDTLRPNMGYFAIQSQPPNSDV
ncbi:MAG: DUF1998 domain-containing protein [Anaerolineae bacterium]|nr:DUF1998 domain-containing protein [Anaerolineae bacterium]